MSTMSRSLCLAISVTLLMYTILYIIKFIIVPKIIDKTTKEINRNPKWITNELHSKYYGFSDIDFIIAHSRFGGLPRFRVSRQDFTRLELFISEDTSTRDIQEIGRIALVGKIKIKHGVFFPDKPLHWLSILCFMLDGGDVTIKEIEKRQETN